MVRAEKLLDGSNGAVSERDFAEGIAEFENALRSAGDDPNVALAANLALAQLLSPVAPDFDREKLERAATHARDARAAALQLGRPEPAYSAACAALGGLLIRVADRRPAEQRTDAVREGCELLREAMEGVAGDDQTRLRRSANLAQALQARLPDLTPAEEEDRLAEARGLYAQLVVEDCGPDENAAITSAYAHLEQRRAALARGRHDATGAIEAFENARALYNEAIKMGSAGGIRIGGSMMGLARLLFESAVHSGDRGLLDEAIDTAQAGLTELAGDLSFEREAMMQVAEYFTARHARTGWPSDAAHADHLSESALNSWYHERGSTEFVAAQNRRLDVLSSVALSAIGSDDHFYELSDLLEQLFDPSERTPQMDAISAMASIARGVSASSPGSEESKYEALTELSDGLESIVAGCDVAESDPVWWVRWLATHIRISEWAEWVGLDPAFWLPALASAGQRMEVRMSELRPGTEPHALGCFQLASVYKAVAIHRQSRGHLIEALRRLSIAQESAAKLSTSHRIALGIDGAFICELLGERNEVFSWVDKSLAALHDLERNADAPLVARLAVDRERYQLAGLAAAATTSPEELAWRVHSTVCSAVDNQRDRQAFLDETLTLSSSVSVVFLAQSRRACRAAIARDGRWTQVELPDLALDRVGEFITAAQHANIDAMTGEIGARNRRDQAIGLLNQKVAGGLAPLKVVLRDDGRPVALRLSGWLHAVPLAPSLAAVTGFSMPIAVSLGLAQVDSNDVGRSRELVALGAPGDGQQKRHLARVIDDVNEVAEMFDGGEAIIDACIADVEAALTEARLVLIASHGESSDRAESARLILHDGDLTAGAILEQDLRGLHLAVIASCEAIATDRIAPDHPFNVLTSVVRAGASMACGPQWAIDDEVASLFARTIFKSVAGGQSVLEAFSEASQQTQQRWPAYRDLTLFVGHERLLAVP